jgi:hypothetical protein
MRRTLFGTVALAAAALIVAGAALAETYDTGFEEFNLGSVNTQEGWHSLPVLPALPQGYDQEVVDNSAYGQDGGPAFGDKSLRLSNAYTNGEFQSQTYSASTAENAGEAVDNNEYVGEFQFISTSAAEQPGLRITVSPDDGVGSRMSYVSLTDTPGGIQMTFYDTDATGAFVPHDLGTFDRNVVHTIKFWIKFVPGEANDIVRFFVDGVDQGNRLRECFTTWEQYYRYKELEGPQVTNSLEFRSDGTAALGTLGQGYLFDNVVNTTADGDGPAPTTCGLADDGLIAPTGTTCSQYRDDIAPVLGQLLYNTKGSGINTKINAVSPGVFFYYTRVSGDAGETVGITEDPDGGQAIPVSQSQVVLYDAFTCRVVKDWTPTVNPDGSASGELPTEGDFIIGVKYNPSALKGQEAPASPPITYSFGTTLEGAPFQVESTIDLALKN